MEGYGRVYQNIIRDPDISVEAKAVYSYLSCIAGGDGACYPSVSLMQHELAIGRDRLQRSVKELSDKGIITVTQQRKGRRYGSNLYRINSQQPDSQATETQSTESQATESQTPESQKPENPASTNNNITNNSFTNNIKTITEDFNRICVSYPKIQKLSDARKKALSARIRSGYTLEDFRKVFTLAEQSSFLRGKNDRNWSASFDWLIKDANMAKVLEGKYADRGGGGTIARKDDEKIPGIRAWD